MSTNLEKGEPRSRAPTSFKAQANLPPPRTAPSDNADGSVDELTTLLSQSHIRTDPSTSVNDAACLIRNYLPTELESARADGLLTPDHGCFAGARRFCDRRGISSEALQNCLGLACGNLRFPTILLQNPANGHDRLRLGDMIISSPTMSWLEELLGEIGLNMADTVILDVCPLLSAEDLSRMSRDEKEAAIEEAYGVTVEILAAVKPKILISCQCQTRGTDYWPKAMNPVAFQLCSSVFGARNGLVKTVRVKEHYVHVIQAFHPMYILRENEPSQRIVNETILKELLQMVYTPCAAWQREVEMLNSMEAVLRSFVSVLQCVQQTMKNVRTAKEKMRDRGNLNKASLPGWDNVVDRCVAFNDTCRTFQAKLNRMSAEEKRKIETRLGLF